MDEAAAQGGFLVCAVLLECEFDDGCGSGINALVGDIETTDAVDGDCAGVEKTGHGSGGGEGVAGGGGKFFDGIRSGGVDVAGTVEGET